MARFADSVPPEGEDKIFLALGVDHPGDLLPRPAKGHRGPGGRSDEGWEGDP